MNSFVGKHCPFCKTEFTATDDIVVCSDCDMPHHKDCWVENGGCTTFCCLGTVKSADGGASTVTSTHMEFELFDVAPQHTAFCSKCGANNTDTALFCVKCGNRLVNESTSSVTATAPAHTVFLTSIATDVLQLICVNTAYYVSKFTAMDNHGNESLWNWSAFFAAPLWLLYRRMYKQGVAVLAGIVLAAFLGTPPLFLVYCMVGIGVGVFGNATYKRHVELKATEAKTMIEPLKSQHLSKYTGVDTTACVIGSVVCFVVITLSLF